VIVNGVPAPLYAIANVNGHEQINFQVPWEISGLNLPGPYTIPAVSIVVVNNGAASPAMHAFFNQTFPAIITSDGKQAVAIHANGSPVASQNPAHSGEVITFYGVGFGPVTPLPATGAPAGASPPSIMRPAPSVTINAHNATVEFAGLSPGSVGLYQFNVVVSDQVGNGNLNVFFTIGGLHPPACDNPGAVGSPLHGTAISALLPGCTSPPFGRHDPKTIVPGVRGNKCRSRIVGHPVPRNSGSEKQPVKAHYRQLLWIAALGRCGTSRPVV